MHFAYPLPWWLAILLAAAIGAVAYLEYRRPLSPLTPSQRGVLVGLRVLALAALVLFVFRPIALLPPAGSRDAVVPVLVDVSRSMRLADADGQTRLARANGLLKNELAPALTSRFKTEIFAAGDGLAPGKIDGLAADARRTDLSGALDAVRERYRGQRVAGIVVLSDGGDTGAGGAGRAGRAGGSDGAGGADSAGGPPVFAVGIGSPDGPRDREVLGITAGDPRLDQATVDLHVTAVSTGFGRAPFSLRVLANGQLLDTRRLVPTADGSPIDQAFTVSPDPLNATVYTAEIPRDDAEAGRREQQPQRAGQSGRPQAAAAGRRGRAGLRAQFHGPRARRRRRARVDSVTRKGKNGDGQDTFFVQAGGGRAAALTLGFPATREQLFAYDAIVIANVEGDFFTRAQLKDGRRLRRRARRRPARARRPLVRAARLVGTPLEEVLPVELNDRRGGLVRASLSGDVPRAQSPGADAGRRGASGHAHRRHAGRDAQGCGRRCRRSPPARRSAARVRAPPCWR